MMIVNLISEKLENVVYEKINFKVLDGFPYLSNYYEPVSDIKLISDFNEEAEKIISDIDNNLKNTVSSTNNNKFIYINASDCKEEELLIKEIISFYIKKELSNFIARYEFNHLSDKIDTSFQNYFIKLAKDIYKTIENKYSGRINSIVHNFNKEDVNFFYNENGQCSYRIRIIRISDYMFQIYVNENNYEIEGKSYHFSKATLSLDISSLTKEFDKLISLDIEFIIKNYAYLLYKNNMKQQSVSTNMVNMINNPEKIKLLEFSKIEVKTDTLNEKLLSVNKIVGSRKFDCDTILYEYISSILSDISKLIKLDNCSSFKDSILFKNGIKRSASKIYNDLVMQYETSYNVLKLNVINDIYCKLESDDSIIIINIFKGQLTDFDMNISIIDENGNEKFFYQDHITGKFTYITDKNIEYIKDNVLEFPMFDSEDGNDEVRNSYTIFRYLEQKYLYDGYKYLK